MNVSVHPIYDANLMDMSIAVFDFETTGVHAHTDAIIQMAVVHVDQGSVGEKWSSKVNPGEQHFPLDPWIIENVGVTADDLRKHPPLSESFPQFAEKIGTRIVAGQNIKSFDFKFVYPAERQTGIDVQTQYYFDTLRVMQKLVPNLSLNGKKNHKLANIGRYYALDFDEDGLHDALADTTLTAQVMLKQFEQLAADHGVQTFGEMVQFMQ